MFLLFNFIWFVELLPARFGVCFCVSKVDVFGVGVLVCVWGWLFGDIGGFGWNL